jgi:hypothetical protein
VGFDDGGQVGSSQCHVGGIRIHFTVRSKLHDNSSYGGTIMDQEKFQSITYVQGEDRVMLEANKPQFKKLSTLNEEDEYFEVEKAKEKLAHSE